MERNETVKHRYLLPPQWVMDTVKSLSKANHRTWGNEALAIVEAYLEMEYPELVAKAKAAAEHVA